MLRSTTPPPPVGPSSQPAAPRSEGPAPARRFTDTAFPTTFGPRLRVHGSISGAESVEICGQVEGPVDIDGLLRVAEGARVTGSVTAADAVIEGELVGRLTARGRVELRATARVRAEIHAPTIAIAEGCFFDGRIHMGGSEGDGGPTHFREKRRRRGGRGTAGPEAAAAAAPGTAIPAAPPVASPGGAPAAPPAAAAGPSAVTEPATPDPAAVPAASEPAAPSAVPAAPLPPRPVV